MYENLLDKLSQEHVLSHDEYLTLLRHRDEMREYAANLARAARQTYYGNKIYIRGLIEFTNYCKNNCLYCGIRAGNQAQERRDPPCQCQYCRHHRGELPQIEGSGHRRSVRTGQLSV